MTNTGKLKMITAGTRFGKFVVKKRAGVDGKGRATWTCRCKCGTEKVFTGTRLRTVSDPYCECSPATPGQPQTDCLEAYEKIIRRLATNTGINDDDIRSDSRDRLLSAARRVIATTLKSEGHGYSSIGRAMNRNHSSVLRMCYVTKQQALQELAIALGQRSENAANEMIRGWEDEVVTMICQPTMSDRDGWDFMLRRLAETSIPEQREKMWRTYCEQTFPHSWQYQAAAPPQGLAW